MLNYGRVNSNVAYTLSNIDSEKTSYALKTKANLSISNQISMCKK